MIQKKHLQYFIYVINHHHTNILQIFIYFQITPNRLNYENSCPMVKTLDNVSPVTWATREHDRSAGSSQENGDHEKNRSALGSLQYHSLTEANSEQGRPTACGHRETSWRCVPAKRSPPSDGHRERDHVHNSLACQEKPVKSSGR